MEPVVAPPLAAQSIDVPCIHCGYNLRGLTSGGLCPECGKTIDDSLRGDFLRFANPNWLRKVRLGIKLQLWAIMLSILLGLGAAALAFGAGLVPNAMQLAGIVPTLIGIWATLALTTREPREALQNEGVSVRMLLRTTACLLPGFQIVHIVSDLLPETLTLAVTILGYFLWPLQNALFLIYMRRFTQRVPDEKLYRSSTRLIYVGSVFYGLQTVLSAYIHYQIAMWRTAQTTGALPPGPPTFLKLLMPAFSVLMLVMLILFLWYVRLLTKYRRVLGEQLVLAEGVTGSRAGGTQHDAAFNMR